MSDEEDNNAEVESVPEDPDSLPDPIILQREQITNGLHTMQRTAGKFINS